MEIKGYSSYKPEAQNEVASMKKDDVQVGMAAAMLKETTIGAQSQQKQIMQLLVNQPNMSLQNANEQAKSQMAKGFLDIKV